MHYTSSDDHRKYKSTENYGSRVSGSSGKTTWDSKTIEGSGKWTKFLSKVFPSGFQAETKALLKIAIPVIVTNMCSFLLMTESIIMCGHLGKYELDGAALANSMINALGITIGIGVSTACDTFFSQLFGSAHKKRIGLILQRSMLIISIFPFIIWALHINMEPIFILLGQDLEVSSSAARYMIYFSPGLFFSYHGIILARYLQNQNKVFAPMVIGILGNIFNVLSQYICIYVLNFPMESSAVCQAAAFFFIWILEVIYIVATKMYKETWSGWTREAFLDWGPFLGLALPGVAMVTLETFCWEIGTFVAGLMGPTQLGTQSIIFQLNTIIFNIAFGVAVAVNIRVGQSLGGMMPQNALTSYRCGIAVMFVSSLITGTLYASLHDYLPYLFTDDIEVIQESSKIIFLLFIVQIIDSASIVTMGALRGCGRQKIGTLFVIVSYYLLGQPTGISLAFLADLKVAGLWIGLIISLSITSTCALIFANKQDWERQAKLAQERILQGTDLELEPTDSDETTGLLSSEEIHQTRHRRTPSQPRSCSMAQVDLPLTRYVTEEEYVRVYIKCLVWYILAILVFVGGLIIKIYLPREIYWPAVGNTTTLYAYETTASTRTILL